MAQPLWTQAHIDALAATIASGELTVNYAGPPAQSVTYQSLGEMRKLLAEMRREVSGRKRFRRVAISKGFDSE
jgi:agmatine/peptidylarginine deiminase